MLPVALNCVYSALLIAISPWLLYRRIVQRKPVAGQWRKLAGQMERRHPDRPCAWFHAVSVGEVLQLQSLVAEFAARHPQFEILITTTTGTGFDVARQKFPQHTICYWPFDFSWAVSRALQTVSPTLVVLVELELWPNFLLAAQRLQVPVALINGRIGAKSHRGYRRLKWLWRRVLPALSHCAVQTDEFAQRLIDLGVPAERVTVTGNIKFDRVQSDRCNPKTEELHRGFGIRDSDLVFIAGSTQEPEEKYAIQAWQAASQAFPQLRLIIVPRHKERFDEVARLIESHNLPLMRRSSAVSGTLPSVPNTFSTAGKNVRDTRTCPGHELPPIILLDTLGELAACWGLADIAFVGGSLTNRGGQNMLEPAGYGAAVLFGPNTWNFKDIVKPLLDRKAAVIVRTADELRDRLLNLLRDATERQHMGSVAREFVLSQQGATARTLTVLESLRESASNSRAAA